MINNQKNLIIPPPRITYHPAWMKEGESRFGTNRELWKYVCPLCHTIIMGKDYSYYNKEGAWVARICIAYDGGPCEELTNEQINRTNPVGVIMGENHTVYAFQFYINRMVLSPMGLVGIESL